MSISLKVLWNAIKISKQAIIIIKLFLAQLRYGLIQIYVRNAESCVTKLSFIMTFCLYCINPEWRFELLLTQQLLRLLNRLGSAGLRN